MSSTTTIEQISPFLETPYTLSEAEYCTRARYYKSMGAILRGVTSIAAGVALIVFGASSGHIWAVGAGIWCSACGIAVLKEGILLRTTSKVGLNVLERSS